MSAHSPDVDPRDALPMGGAAGGDRTPATAADPAGARGDDAQDARARLLDAGLRLFAQQGYAKTSTRELAEAASVNVAAISYYFRDKAGLYRAVFFEPMGGVPDADDLRFALPSLGLAEGLRAFYDVFLAPLKQGDTARLCMKLHFREMLEPTGLWDEELAHGIQPQHLALVRMLCRHLRVAEPDDDLQRLAVSLAGLGVHLHVGRDVIDTVAPGLMASPQALDMFIERLVMYGLAMVQAEAGRRGLHLDPDGV